MKPYMDAIEPAISTPLQFEIETREYTAEKRQKSFAE